MLNVKHIVVYILLNFPGTISFIEQGKCSGTYQL
jgi:hypothetical protein